MESTKTQTGVDAGINETQPASTNYAAQNLLTGNIAPVMKVGEWVLTLFLLAIPVVNLILLLVWGFGNGSNPNKSNFAKAQLLWMLIGIVLIVIFWSMIIGIIASVAM